jgi:hypothetical protein
MSVNVDDTAASSSSGVPRHRRAPKPQDVSEVKGPTASSSSRFPHAPWRASKLDIVSEVNEPIASPSELRAPKPQQPVGLKLEWLGHGPLAIAWDCQLYTQQQFFVYYGRDLEFQQCEELTDEIIGCIGFMLEDSLSVLTSHELRLLHCLKEMCCRHKGTSMLGLKASEELVIFAKCVYAPLWYRKAFLSQYGLSADRTLRRDEGAEIMARWKNDEMPQWKFDGMRGQNIVDRVRRRSAFWAHVYRVVGSTHLAKCLINYGLISIDALSYVLHEVLEDKNSDMHKKNVTINALPLTEPEQRLRRDAKWFTLRCKQARKRIEESGSQPSSKMDWLEGQREEYAAMRLDRKRKSPDITANAMQEAGSLDVYEKIEAT